MRILIPNYYPLNTGGAQASTYLVAKKLEEMGNDVIIASTGDYKEIKTYYLKKFRLWPFFLQHRYLKRLLLKIMEKERIDFIHPQERLTTIGSILAAKEKGIPVVVHFRDYWFACPESSCLMPNYEECEICSYGRILRCFKKRILWNVYKWRAIKSSWKLLNEADKKIAISSVVKRKLEICGIREAVIIPNPIDLESFRANMERVEEIREKYDVQSPVILYVGALMYHKGILNLLRVMTDETLRRTDLLVIGDGNLRRECEDFVRKRGLKHVKFVGKVPLKDIPNFYAASDIVVFPSIWQEPFGRVVLEAMAAGKPVVASNVGGVVDLIINGENGYLVEPLNDKMWVKYLNMLISDELLRERLGKNGKKLSANFDTEVVTRKIIDVYRTLMGDSNG